MSTSVKWISSDMRGAPTLNGQAGTLLAVLDALFTTGWGAITPLSISVSGGVATASVASGQTFLRDSVILVSGATPSLLNEEAKVLSSTPTQITWATTAPDGAATGTISIKYAPQTSWVKAFAGTNKAAYRSTHPQASGHYVRIDDSTNSTQCRVRGFETMSDVDTGTGPFPTDTQLSGGGYWWKSTVANSNAIKYRIFCDERIVYLCVAPGTASSATNFGAPARGFGDPVAAAQSGDPWTTLLSCTGTTNTSYASTGSFESNGSVAFNTGFVISPRAFSGLGLPVLQTPTSYTGASYSGSDNTLGSAPSPIDGRIRTSRMFTKEQGTGNPVRADIPGIYYIPQTGVSALVSDGDTFIGSGELEGRRLLALLTVTNYVTAPSFVALVDLTGPWR